MNWTLLDSVGVYDVYARDVPGGCLVSLVSPGAAAGSGLAFVPGATVADIQAAWS